MNVIEINNLTKYYGKFKAVDNINLEIKKGEIFGFIGPNGAGKSTTIRTMLNVLKASRGSISIFGKDYIKDVLEIHQNIAYVPGEVNLWPNLNGGQIIDLFLNIKNIKDRTKAKELIKEFDLDINKKAKSYSKGNKQKVALIAALASNADLYILDEPTSGLDPLMEQIFQEKILELKKQGKTILLSSHILSEVEKLCDRIAIIKEGKIIETGSLKEMRHLTRMHIEVVSDTKINLDNINYLYNIKQNDNNLAFEVDSENFDKIIKELNKYKIVNLISQAPTLEDLFLRYYEGHKNE